MSGDTVIIRKGRLDCLTPELVRAGIATARDAIAESPDDFRRNQQAWISKTSGILEIKLRDFLATNIATEPEKTEAGIQGAHLGIAIVRQLVDARTIEVAEVNDNLRSHLQDSVLGIGNPDNKQELSVIFGEEIATVLARIRHESARRGCSFILSACLTNEADGII